MPLCFQMTTKLFLINTADSITNVAYSSSSNDILICAWCCVQKTLIQFYRFLSIVHRHTMFINVGIMLFISSLDGFRCTKTCTHKRLRTVRERTQSWVAVHICGRMNCYAYSHSVTGQKRAHTHQRTHASGRDISYEFGFWNGLGGFICWSLPLDHNDWHAVQKTENDVVFVENTQRKHMYAFQIFCCIPELSINWCIYTLIFFFAIAVSVNMWFFFRSFFSGTTKQNYNNNKMQRKWAKHNEKTIVHRIQYRELRIEYSVFYMFRDLMRRTNI